MGVEFRQNFRPIWAGLGLDLAIEPNILLKFGPNPTQTDPLSTLLPCNYTRILKIYIWAKVFFAEYIRSSNSIHQNRHARLTWKALQKTSHFSKEIWWGLGPLRKLISGLHEIWLLRNAILFNNDPRPDLLLSSIIEKSHRILCRCSEYPKSPSTQIHPRQLAETKIGFC